MQSLGREAAPKAFYQLVSIRVAVSICYDPNDFKSRRFAGNVIKYIRACPKHI